MPNWKAGTDVGWDLDWYGYDSSLIPGYGPDGLGAFSLDLNNGYTVTYRWVTDVIKTRSGREQRISRNDHPKEIYEGLALLFDGAPAELRAQMAKHAAQGQAFQLGLPHEELSVTDDHAGTTLYVTSTTNKDWMNPGQRVIVRHGREQVTGVIQSTTATSITLDVDPGEIGDIGATVMPSMPIYLDPEQGFPRHPVEAEAWEIRAQAAVFDFARGLATLALGPLTTCAGLEDATVTARYPGSTPTLAFDPVNALVAPCKILETATVTIIQFKPGVCTPADVYDKLTFSALMVPTGTWGAGTLEDPGDAFVGGTLGGGSLAGPIGTGAALTMYASRPVWDREIDNDSTITDSIHSQTEVLDFGGLPYSIGAADMADWGRTVAMTRPIGAEFQWFKLFMSTVKGRQKAFWLPTWRDDLPCIAEGTGTITVDADVAAWWPAQRQHVQVQHDGGIDYYEVTAATRNTDGTWTLTIGATLTGVTMVSWLELARFTEDDFNVRFDSDGFTFEGVATVVQQ